MVWNDFAIYSKSNIQNCLNSCIFSLQMQRNFRNWHQLFCGCVFTRSNNQLNILSRCLFTEQHLLLKCDFCFLWKFNPENSNYKSAQLSKLAEGGSAFLAIFVRRWSHFFQRMPLKEGPSRETGKSNGTVYKRKQMRWTELVCRFKSSVSYTEPRYARQAGKYYSRLLWHASVTTRNVIGCGIYQDKLYHLAR